MLSLQVESWSQLRQLLVLGSSARTEADTPENSKSSRGHAILTLEVRSAVRYSYNWVHYNTINSVIAELLVVHTTILLIVCTSIYYVYFY